MYCLCVDILSFMLVRLLLCCTPADESLDAHVVRWDYQSTWPVCSTSGMNNQPDADGVQTHDSRQPSVAPPVHASTGNAPPVYAKTNEDSWLMDQGRRSYSSISQRSSREGAAGVGKPLQRSTSSPDRPHTAAHQLSSTDLVRAPFISSSSPPIADAASVNSVDMLPSDIRSPSSFSGAEQDTPTSAHASPVQHATRHQRSLGQQLTHINSGVSSSSNSQGAPQSHSSSSMGRFQSEVTHAVEALTAGAQQGVPDLLLAGESVVPAPAPTAAECVISTAVEHQHEGGLRNGDSGAEAQLAQQSSAVDLSSVPGQEGASSSSSHRKPARQDATRAAADSIPSNSSSSSSGGSRASTTSSSSSTHRRGLPLPAMIALGVSAAAAAAVAVGAIVIWLKRRSKAPAAAAEPEDEFTRALKEMDAEEKAFDKEAAMDDDTGAELSAEEAALAMQQADAARKEKMIAAALAEGDAELAKIDALGSVDLDALDPDELAALEAELAELEGGDADAPLGAGA